MWTRKRLDIGWSDLAFGLGHCCTSHDLSILQERVEAACSDSGDALACLSVRSGFDLLLDAWDFPAGSEVLMSALTIHDMPRIVEQHGLIPVPVDIDADDLSPNRESLRRAIGPASRAIVVAHLFGSRAPLEPVLEAAKRHGLVVVEDCAQAFDGHCRGRPGTDASLFSFGAIKTATALQGAIVRVPDRELLKRMRCRQGEHGRQTSHEFSRRLLKYAGLKALSYRPLFGVLFHALRAIGCDVDRVLNRMARGFPGPDLLRQIRRRPSSPLLALLERRLRTFDESRLSQRIAKAQRLAGLLEGVPRLGRLAASHTHWVFPVLADEPQRLIGALRKAGFDATQGQSMCVVPAPAGRPELFPATATRILAQTVYLPFYADMPQEEIERMAAVVREAMVGREQSVGCPGHSSAEK